MRIIIIGVLGTMLSWTLLWFNARPDELLHVYFLDVGQGDAILLRTPSGKNILVDGGPGTKVLSELSQTLPFFDKGIDYLILTHPDRDHIEGLIHVLQRYKVAKILTTGVHKSDFFSKAFFTAAAQKAAAIQVIDKNDDIVFEDGVILDFLYPFKKNIRIMQDTNNTSLVVKVIYGNNELLLPGDAEWPQEGLLVGAGVNLAADVLKIGHHGSRTSTTKEFLQSVKPRYGVISVGTGNTYGHPNSHVLRKLREQNITTLRTDLCGRIHFAFSADALKIRAPSDCNFSSNLS